jgi:transcriptional regulator with XRE-family HTH domain
MEVSKKKSADRQKFSPAELYAKEQIKDLRLSRGIKMIEGSSGMGMTVKNLEDIETPRAYGCHITLDILLEAVKYYEVDINCFVSN